MRKCIVCFKPLNAKERGVCKNDEVLLDRIKKHILETKGGEKSNG